MSEENFQNPQIFDFEIPDFENVELKSISKDYLKIILFNLTIFSAAIIIGYGVLYFKLNQNLTNQEFFLIGFIVLLTIFYLFLNSIIGFKYRKYALREKDLIYQYGWIKRTIIIVPFNRIQHITVAQGWFSRLLKLKTISVFTAGVSGGDISIKGLPEEIAEGINNHIRGTISKENNEDECNP